MSDNFGGVGSLDDYFKCIKKINCIYTPAYEHMQACAMIPVALARILAPSSVELREPFSCYVLLHYCVQCGLNFRACSI